jgi:uncharacterized protein (TIGR00369 family)
MDAVAEFKFGVSSPADIAGMSGKEIPRAIIGGELPHPRIAKSMTFWITEVDDGVAAFGGGPGAHLLNPMGALHGGWALTLIDSSRGCAGLSLLPAGSGFATIETKANLSRAITKDTGRVRAAGRVVAQGKQIISVEAKVLRQDGRVLAHGTSTLMILGAK